MKYPLAQMVLRIGKTRRRAILLRPIKAPATMASDLFASCYAPIIREWEQVIPRILAEYERAASEQTTDSPADIGQVLSDTEDGVLRLVLTIKLRLEQWGFSVERYTRSKWRATVLSGTGIDIGTLIGPADARTTIAAAVERNVSLVKSVSEQARARIGESVFRGLTQRKPAREVAKEIRESVAMSRRRALNIASDQLTSLASELADERAREAGLTHYKWIHSGKAHPRPEHLARDGDIFEYGEPAGDTPGQAIWCGCTSQARLSLDPNDEF